MKYYTDIAAIVPNGIFTLQMVLIPLPHGVHSDDWRQTVTNYRKRVDANHGEIKSVAKAAGYFVADTARMGEGFPDLVIANHAGRVALLFENKTPVTPMKPGEVEFILKLVSPVYRIVMTGEQVVKIMSEVE